MMYLIKKGNNYIVMDNSIEEIRKRCGKDAKILFYWKEENQEEALKSLFSNIKMDSELLELYVMAGIEEKDMNKAVEEWYEQDKDILSTLRDIDVINSKEKDELSEMNEESKKKQIELVSEYYLKNKKDKRNKSR